MSRRPLAAADILDIWDRIADDSLAAADEWVDELDELSPCWPRNR